MSVWASTTAVPAMAPGDQVIVSNASTGGAALLQAVAPMQVPGNPTNLTVINGSSVSLDIRVAADNSASANYQSTGYSCNANSAYSFSTTAPFVALYAASDPGTGVITICR